MWYGLSRMEEINLRERLSQLDILRATVYAIGCATHAKDRITGKKADQVDRALNTVAMLLDTFWNLYPQSLREDILHPLVVQSDGLTPVEGIPEHQPGIGKLIWSVAYAFSVAEKKELDEDIVLSVEATAWNAYEAVFSFYHEQGHIYPTEEAICEVEMNSAACQGEIEFQLAFLTILEKIQGQPPSYITMLQQMGRGH